MHTSVRRAEQSVIGSLPLRYKNWLWAYLSTQGINSQLFNTPDADAYFFRFIRDYKIDIKKIQIIYNSVYVHESHIEWIADDLWQECWIKYNLASQLLWVKDYFGLTSRERSIFAIDTWNMPSDQKIHAIASLRSQWEQQAVKDQVYRKFFDTNTSCKFEMLTNWVSENASDADFHSPHGYTREKPVSIKQLKDVLECLNIKLSPLDAKLCFDAIKKRCSQIKYRDGLSAKKKKQCNVVLTSKSLDLLDAFAEKNLLSRAQILEILIRSEAERKQYISEWIKVAQSLE